MYSACTAEDRVLTKEREFLVYGERNAINRHVVIDNLPYAFATCLKSDAVMARVANIDILMLRSLEPATGNRAQG